MNITCVLGISKKGHSFRETTFSESKSLPPFKKGSAVKGKNLLRMRSTFFLFRVDPFSEGIGVQGSKHEITKRCHPYNQSTDSTSGSTVSEFRLEKWS